MHELSIAMSILDFACEYADRDGTLRVKAIRVRVGPLSGVTNSALRSAYETAKQGTSMDSSELVIEETNLIAFCPTCSDDRAIHSPQSLHCPVCGTPTPEIVSGRELDIVEMEIYS